MNINNKILNGLKRCSAAVRYINIRRRKITILSNNCAAVFLYKHFGCKYLSPTINLQIAPKDYIKLCKNLDYYMNASFEEDKSPNNELFKCLGGGAYKFSCRKIIRFDCLFSAL